MNQYSVRELMKHISDKENKEWEKLATECGVTGIHPICGEFKEVDMNERMTRKELTEKVKELKHMAHRHMEYIQELLNKTSTLEKLVCRQEETSTPWDRFSALIEFLGLEGLYVCGTDGHYEFKKKKVRKPYVRTKQ